MMVLYTVAVVFFLFVVGVCVCVYVYKGLELPSLPLSGIILASQL